MWHGLFLQVKTKDNQESVGGVPREELDLKFSAGELDVSKWARVLLYSLYRVSPVTGWLWGTHVGAAVGVDYFGLYVLLTHRDRRAIRGMCAKASLQSPGAPGVGPAQGREGGCPGAEEVCMWVRNHSSCLGSQRRR